MSEVQAGGSGHADTQVPLTVLPVHLPARYMRSRLEVINGELPWETPRRFLGVIPLDWKQARVPLSEVATIGVQTRLRPTRFLMGLALIALPWAVAMGILEFVMVVCGIWILIVSLDQFVKVVTRSGQTERASVCYGHKLDADLNGEAVEVLIDQGPTPSAA